MISVLLLMGFAKTAIVGQECLVVANGFVFRNYNGESKEGRFKTTELIRIGLDQLYCLITIIALLSYYRFFSESVSSF